MRLLPMLTREQGNVIIVSLIFRSRDHSRMIESSLGVFGTLASATPWLTLKISTATGFMVRQWCSCFNPLFVFFFFERSRNLRLCTFSTPDVAISAPFGMDGESGTVFIYRGSVQNTLDPNPVQVSLLLFTCWAQTHCAAITY